MNDSNGDQMTRPKKKRGKNRGRAAQNPDPRALVNQPKANVVESLLDVMEDGSEYASIVDLVSKDPSPIPEFRRGISEIEQIRGRPCVCYVSNLVKNVANTSIEASDYLPFVEMIGKVQPAEKRIDVLLASPGGSAETVAKLVEALRRRFEHVSFIVPADAMSAATLFALSGDEIWMTERAYLGPIDPQVPSKDGRFVPAQALLSLLAKIQADGQARIDKNLQPEWSHVVLLKNMDQKELGAAITSSGYVINMATEFLRTHKFGSWANHSSTGTTVTAQDKEERAAEIARELCSHSRWKAHGHAIGRDVLWDDLRLKIDRPEDLEGFNRALRRLWALWYYTLDRASVSKVLLSANYSFARTAGAQQ